MVKHFNLTQKKTGALSINLLLNHYSNVPCAVFLPKIFHFSQIPHLTALEGTLLCRHDHTE